MRIELDIGKNVEQNAAIYYEAAKKAKKKLEGALIALKKSEEELEKIKKASLLEQEKKVKAREEKTAKKQEWYEKFRWFLSSEGFLCVGGRDATTNEIVVKKHMQPNDIVFHTEMAGSPFFIVKTDGKTPSETTLKETAIATASFSRAWKLGVAYAEVFYVAPEQVSKSAPSGQYIAKGAFMIYGRKNHLNTELKLALGVDENSKVMCGPVSAAEKHCKAHVKILPGNEKASDTAKKIMKKLNAGGISLDDVIRALPSGGYKIEA